MLKYLLVIILTASCLTSIAQRRITGKVLNDKNEAVVSASIIITKTKKGTSTNSDGTFTLNVAPGTYEITITAIGYNPKTITDIEVKADADATLNISLSPAANVLGEFTVKSTTVSARRETASAAIAFQRNTNTVASVVSAESIRRSPDKNTGEVLKRTPGASLIDGKFIVIRGLADRYNQAMLNGVLLSSTEPDRKTFSFDIIPAQMIDNIVINKAFVPELPGEWAGGLIQVNTKDIPSRSFFNVQVGTGFNAQTVSNDFYKAKGGNTDWLGIDDGTRNLPSRYTTKSGFNLMTNAERAAIGRDMNNDWSAKKINVSPNFSLQINGGFTGTLLGKKIGGVLGINYAKSNRYIDILNQAQSLNNDGTFSQFNSYKDARYTQEVTVGALASFTIQLNTNNKVSLKSIINLNTNNYNIKRTGINNVLGTGSDVIGGEIAFRQNTFFTSQISGEHNIIAPLKLKWYGSFNILDGFSPDQRRYQYTRDAGTTKPYAFLVGSTLAQESGSRVFQTLSDYIYTAGGDAAYNFNLFKQKQTIKGGYMLQVKDRLFDAQLFANFIPKGDNPALRALPIDKIFAPENFGDGSPGSDLFSFNSINNKTNRYLANTILNAGFVQLDNQLSTNLRLVWGLRVENYDQLLGSVKQWDERHKHTKQTDYLPGANLAYKLNSKTNIRVTGSQTVIRPELRELSALTLYDFELNAAVLGNPNLERTKVTNFDVRYELYPRSGEVITAGVFYKHFDKPIEQTLQQGGTIFTFENPEKANTYGVEVEVRKKLDAVSALKNFTVSANAAYIYSRVKDEKRGIDRQLQGQSPYLINVGIMYDLEKAGFNTTLLFNQIGKRIYTVGEIAAASGGVPDIWEKPRPILDLQIGKKLIKNKAELRLNVSDIINQKQIFYQNNSDNTDLNKSVDKYRFTRKNGTTFSVTFNYSL